MQGLSGGWTAPRRVFSTPWLLAGARVPTSLQAIFKSFHGHACALTGAQFTAKDEYLVSAGGTSIFVWKVVQ